MDTAKRSKENDNEDIEVRVKRVGYIIPNNSMKILTLKKMMRMGLIENRRIQHQKNRPETQ